MRNSESGTPAGVGGVPAIRQNQASEPPPRYHWDSQNAQLVAEYLRSYRADPQGLSRWGAGSPYTPTTPLPAVKVGPSARACGAPLTGLP
jgi:hypothetical protein